MPKINDSAIVSVGGAGKVILNEIIKAGCLTNSISYDISPDDLDNSKSNCVMTGYPPNLSVLNNYRRLVVIAGLGGIASYKIINEIIHMDCSVEINFVVCLPSGFEGTERKNRAERLITNIKSKDCHVEIIDLEILSHELPDDITVIDFLLCANEKVRNIVGNLIT